MYFEISELYVLETGILKLRDTQRLRGWALELESCTVKVILEYILDILVLWNCEDGISKLLSVASVQVACLTLQICFHDCPFPIWWAIHILRPSSLYINWYLLAGLALVLLSDPNYSHSCSEFLHRPQWEGEKTRLKETTVEYQWPSQARQSMCIMDYSCVCEVQVKTSVP